MAKKKNKKPYKRKKYSLNERRAYWIGVGISAERHGDGDRIFSHPSEKVRKSASKGYEADNSRDVSNLPNK